jgi:hypothetical protein
MLMSATLTRAQIPSFCHELVVRLAFRTDVQRTPRRHSGFVPACDIPPLPRACSARILRPRIDGESQTYPSLKILCVQFPFDEASARERPNLWPAQTFEQRNTSLKM